MAFHPEPRTIVLTSKDDFILVGRDPSRDSALDRVLIRSSSAPIELLGFVRDSEKGRRDEFELTHRSRMRRARPESRMMMALSDTLAPSPTWSDTRSTRYALAWVGDVSAAQRSRIEDSLQNNLADVVHAIQRDDAGAVEWAFSEVAYAISSALASARARRQRAEFLLRVYLGLTALLAFAVFAYFLVIRI